MTELTREQFEDRYCAFCANSYYDVLGFLNCSIPFNLDFENCEGYNYLTKNTEDNEKINVHSSN